MTLKTVSFQSGGGGGGGVTSITAGTNLTGGTITSAGTIALAGTIDAVAIGATTPSTGAFTWLSTSSSTSTTPVLSFNASNTSVANGGTVAGSYLQDVFQNKSGTAGASTNYVTSNDVSTDSTNYGEFGINSSVFSSGTPGDFYSINSGVYFSGHDGDISVGSGNGYKTYLTWGSAGQSAHVINATGAIGFSTNLGTTPANTGTAGFGTAGQALITQGGTSAPSWGILSVAGGGTGLSSTPANGQIDIGNGSGFTRTTLTAGSGVSIANASGAITISATGGGGGVTSVVAASPLTGGTITSTGTIGLGTAGTAGTYGSATSVPVITTDAYGRVTSVTPTTITAPTPNALTFGTGLTATGSFNGSSAVSVALTSPVTVALGGTGLSSTPANGQIDIGNGSGFTRTTLTAGSGVSIANASGAITISATGGVTSITAGTNLTGGTITSAGTIALAGTINSVAIGATTPSTGAFTWLSTSSSTSTTPVLSFNASNTSVAKGDSVAGSYLQDVLQNKSGTAGASTNYVTSNDVSTDSTNYGEFGINSSVFSSGTPVDFYSINSGVYFSGHDGDISVGSGNGYKTYLTWGSAGQSAHVINATGAIGFSTNLGTTPANTGTVGFGTAGQALITQGGTSAPSWGTLGVVGGGTGLSSTPANGQIDIGNGSGFTRTTLTAGSGVSIANASGAITISATGGGGGGVTSITAGTNLTGGTITSAGTIALAGTIDAVAIGATTPSTGAFTTLVLNSVSQSPYAATPLFGTGADGAVTISSGTTTLTRDANYTNLTISGSGVLKTGNFNVYVSGTLDISAAAAGAINNDGTSASNPTTSTGGTQGANTAGRILIAGSDGTPGSTGTTATGTTPNTPSVGLYIMGGRAGLGASGGTSGIFVAGSPGGSGGAPGIASLSFPSVTKNPWILTTAPTSTGGYPLGAGMGGSGGGCGGGDGTNTGGGGGGGGAGGSFVTIYASTIARGSNTNTSIIRALGGSGGSPTATLSGTVGGGGGGGAGGGGFVYIVYGSATGSTITNCIDVSGGTGGTGGNGASTGKGGNGGNGGNSGNYQIINLGAPSFTVSVFNAAGTAGSTTTTSTGAAGGAGAIVRGNL